jgi:acyl-CoA thioesterase YciA
MADPVPRGELTLQTIAMPADTNAYGDIFGGWLMAQMDLGAGVAARARAGSRAVTVAVEGMAFHRPVQVGDLVSIYAELLGEGTTSMTIGIEAWVRRQIEGLHYRVTEAKFVFVAVDEAGRKRPLPERAA